MIRNDNRQALRTPRAASITGRRVPSCNTKDRHADPEGAHRRCARRTCYGAEARGYAAFRRGWRGTRPLGWVLQPKDLDVATRATHEGSPLRVSGARASSGRASRSFTFRLRRGDRETRELPRRTHRARWDSENTDEQRPHASDNNLRHAGEERDAARLHRERASSRPGDEGRGLGLRHGIEGPQGAPSLTMIGGSGDALSRGSGSACFERPASSRRSRLEIRREDARADPRRVAIFSERPARRASSREI